MPAKTAIITGANSGLGLATAKALLAADPERHVLLAVRDPGRGAAAADTLGDPRRASVAALDLASLASVQAFTQRFAALGMPALEAVVCNAGTQVVSAAPQLTADGIEVTFAVNHLGHFALVNGLLDQLDRSARVVVVSSDTHDPKRRTGMPKPDYTSAEQLAHPQSGERTPGRQRYTTSKLCNLLFTYELARRVDSDGRDIMVNAFNPGLMPGTGLARDAGALEQFAWNSIMPVLRFMPQVQSPTKAGRQVAALAGGASVSGAYFDRGRRTASSVDSQDLVKAKDLWTVSERLVAAAASTPAPEPT